MPETVTVTFHSADSAGGPCSVDVPRRLGHVTLLREVGQGGMGVVWQARDEFLRRDVAVKLFRDLRLASDELLRRQFIEGARAAAVVKHPNVVSVYHADECEGVIYIVMELVTGCTLREVLTRHQVLDPPLAALVMARVLEAMSAIHEARVVHRDLKPSNVMFDQRGQLLLSDFGLSYQREYAPSDGEVALGTPPYMAPEMFDGEGSYQSDVYAAGIMYYEMLTGQRPFRAGSVAEYRLQHLQRPLPEQSLEAAVINAEVRDILIRSTNKRKIFRYKTAMHMLKAVTDAYPKQLGTELLDRRLNELVLDIGTRRPTTAPDAPAPPVEATYFDLLSKKADDKRRRKADC